MKGMSKNISEVKKMKKYLAMFAIAVMILGINATAVNAFAWPWEEQNSSDKVAEEIASSVVSGATSTTTSPLYMPPYDDIRVDVYRGVALDTSAWSMSTRAAVLLRIIHGDQESIYFILGDEMHKMTEAGIQNQNSNWLIKLKADNGQTLMLFARESYGTATVTGLFGKWLINFEPIGMAYQVYGGQTTPVIPVVTPVLGGSGAGSGPLEKIPAIPVLTQVSQATETHAETPTFWR